MPQKISITDDTIRRIITPDLDRAKAWQDDLRKEREKFLLLYSMSKEADGIKHLNKDGFSQMVSPLVYESVEGMKVGLDQLFTSADFFAVKIGKDADAGERIRKLIRWNIFEAQYGARELRTWLDTALKYHYAPMKVFWDEEYREETQEFDALDQEQAAQMLQQGWELAKFKEQYQPKPMLDEMGMPAVDELGQPVMQDELVALTDVKAVRKVPKFIGPRILAIDPEAFFYSPDSADLDKCRVVAHKLKRRLEDIRRGEDEGRYRKGSYAKVAEGKGGPEETAQDEDDYRYTGIGLDEPDRDADGQEQDYLLKPSKRVTIWEIYTSLDIDKDGLLEPVIIHMCGDVVLNIVENPYKRPPFRVGRAIENPFTFEGKPYPQMLAPLQVEHTQMTRLWNDATALSVYGNLITDDSQLLQDWQERGVGTGLMASTSTMKEKRYDALRPPPLDPSILKSMETVEGRAERISGVTKYNQGIDSNSLNKTATGINIIATLAQARQKYMANVLAETYRDIIEDIVECFKLFGPQYIQYFVSKGNEINPQDYANDFSVEIELGVGPQEKQGQAAVLKELITFAAQIGVPAGFMTMEHVAKAMDRMGQLLGIPLEPYHYSEQELQEQAQQKAMMQQQQKMMMEQAAAQGALPGGPPQQIGAPNVPPPQIA